MFNCYSGCSPTRPVILLLDNHSSHLSLRAIRLAVENNVHMITIPAHTSHFLQPLDLIFKPLKAKFFSLSQTMGVIKGDNIVDKGGVAPVLEAAQDQVCTSITHASCNISIFKTARPLLRLCMHVYRLGPHMWLRVRL